MQNLLLLFVSLFLFTACGDTKETNKPQTDSVHNKKIQKEALLAELKAKEIALEREREEAKMAQAKVLAQEKAKKEAFLQEEASNTQEIKRTQNQQIKNEKLSQIGIQIDKNKITIDTNKTKDFFQKLGKTFESKIAKIAKDIEKGIINEKDAGVRIDESHINIDLNKTKNFLEIWGKKMQDFVKTFDTMAKELETSTSTIDKKK